MQGINTSDVKEGPKVGPVRAGQLGRLKGRPKVAKVAEIIHTFPDSAE